MSNYDSLPPLDRLATLRQASTDVHAAMDATVAELRRAKVTWTTIGETLGTTRQAAQLRFRSAPDVPDDRVVWVDEDTVKVAIGDGTQTVSWDDLRNAAALRQTAQTGGPDGRREPTAETALADRYVEILHQAERMVAERSPVVLEIRPTTGSEDVLRSTYVWGGGAAPGNGLANVHRSWVEEQRGRVAAELGRAGHQVTVR